MFQMKVWKQSRFTKCSTCERLRYAMADAVRKGIPTYSLKTEHASYLDFITMERREYLLKAELAMIRPSKYLSFVVDGADQSASALPHFITKVKGSNGDGLKVHLIAVLQHLTVNQLSLYTMTNDHDKGSNHIVECIHRFINNVARDGQLPRYLFVQLDNCIRENKNHYLLAYLDALVRWNVFDCIEVGFLPEGHTHCDVDQSFSSRIDCSTMMRSHSQTYKMLFLHAIMKRQLCQVLSNSSTGQVCAKRLNVIILLIK